MHEHDEWLRIAREDLKAAKALLNIELFSAVSYFTQQCAEKSLKGYLAFKQHPILKTHDLVKLLEECSLFETSFKKLLDDSRLLNPYASKFRYPTEHEIPDFNDAKMAIHHAQKILAFVEFKISLPDTGQTTLLK